MTPFSLPRAFASQSPRRENDSLSFRLPSPMAHPSIAIFGYSEAGMFLRRVPALDIAGIISIHGNREFPVESDVTRRLDLQFDDVEAPIPGDELSALLAIGRQRMARQNGIIEVPPTKKDAASVIEFAQSVQRSEG